MRNTDVPAIFAAGTEFGLVNANGCMRRATTGFSTGGPEAAGGANLYVGYIEQQHEARQPVWVRWEMHQKIFKRRWQDDVIHIIDEGASTAVKRVMRERRQRGFYGEGLELEEEKDATEAFGFHWEVDGSIVTCKAINKFQREPEKKNMKMEFPVMSGPNQFTSEARRRGTALGRVLRTMDMTNLKESELQKQVARVLLELRSSNHSEELVLKVLRKAECESWAKLTPL